MQHGSNWCGRFRAEETPFPFRGFIFARSMTILPNIKDNIRRIAIVFVAMIVVIFMKNDNALLPFFEFILAPFSFN